MEQNKQNTDTVFNDFESVYPNCFSPYTPKMPLYLPQSPPSTQYQHNYQYYQQVQNPHMLNTPNQNQAYFGNSPQVHQHRAFAENSAFK